MTLREHVRNDRIATRYLFGETAKTLARDYGIGATRVRQVLAAHLQHSRREFYRRFGLWPDDLSRNAIRPRLLHLLNQYRVRTGLAPLLPPFPRRRPEYPPKREKASVCSQSDARGRHNVEGAAQRLDTPERRGID